VETSLIAAMIWALLATLAGMTPTPWHRPIAYTLMAVFLPIAWFLAQDYGRFGPLLFLALAVFQLRLLLISWLKKGLSKLKSGTSNE